MRSGSLYLSTPQITGFEYQVQASIDAIREGKDRNALYAACGNFAHHCRMLDDLRLRMAGCGIRNGLND
ncbi:MAG: hypothetical protein ACLRS8_14550 [Parabacteroides merdae]